MKKYLLLLIPALFLLGAATGAQAAVKAGKVIYSFGQVRAMDAGGKARRLRKGDEIFAGDLLETKRGRAQVRFTDGGFVAVKPNTEYRIDEYHYAGKTDGSERGFFRLLRGGVRFVTGQVGRVNRKNYRVQGAVATIGIRGTVIDFDTHNGIKDEATAWQGSGEACINSTCTYFGTNQTVGCDASGCVVKDETPVADGVRAGFEGIAADEDPNQGQINLVELVNVTAIGVAAIQEFSCCMMTFRQTFADGLFPQPGDVVLAANGGIQSFNTVVSADEFFESPEFRLTFDRGSAQTQFIEKVNGLTIERLSEGGMFTVEAAGESPSNGNGGSPSNSNIRGPLIFGFSQVPMMMEEDFSSAVGHLSFHDIQSHTAVVVAGGIEYEAVAESAFLSVDFDANSAFVGATFTGTASPMNQVFVNGSTMNANEGFYFLNFSGYTMNAGGSFSGSGEGVFAITQDQQNAYVTGAGDASAPSGELQFLFGVNLGAGGEPPIAN